MESCKKKTCSFRNFTNSFLQSSMGCRHQWNIMDRSSGTFSCISRNILYCLEWCFIWVNLSFQGKSIECIRMGAFLQRYCYKSFNCSDINNHYFNQHWSCFGRSLNSMGCSWPIRRNYYFLSYWNCKFPSSHHMVLRHHRLPRNWSFTHILCHSNVNSSNRKFLLCTEWSYLSKSKCSQC